MKFRSWASWHVLAVPADFFDVESFQVRFPSLQQGAERWRAYTAKRSRGSHPRPLGFSALLKTAESMDEVIEAVRNYFSTREDALAFLRNLPVRHELEIGVNLDANAHLVTYGFFEKDFSWIAQAGFVLRFTAVASHRGGTSDPTS